MFFFLCFFLTYLAVSVVILIFWWFCVWKSDGVVLGEERFA